MFTSFCLWSYIIFSTIPLVSSSRSDNWIELHTHRQRGPGKGKQNLWAPSIIHKQLDNSHKSSYTWLKVTFEFSGCTLRVLISGSVVTMRLHHSILFCFRQRGHVMSNVQRRPIKDICNLKNEFPQPKNTPLQLKVSYYILCTGKQFLKIIRSSYRQWNEIWICQKLTIVDRATRWGIQPLE